MLGFEDLKGGGEFDKVMEWGGGGWGVATIFTLSEELS